MAKQSTDSAASYVLSILRIVVGCTFFCHGLQKVFGMFGGMGGHKVPIGSIFGAAGMIELMGGTLIILGLFVRPAAFILCGEMAFAYFRAHFPHGTLPLKNGGEPAVLYCFIFLYLTFAGGGALSVDHFIRSRR